MVEDELDPLITRCPNCSTRFRVTENQLAVAGGQVRCGVCLNVFLGADYLMFDEEPAYATGTEADAALDELLSELGGEEADDLEGAVGDAGPLLLDTAGGSASGIEPFDGPRQLYGGFEDESTDEVSATEARADEAADAVRLEPPADAELRLLPEEVGSAATDERPGAGEASVEPDAAGEEAGALPVEAEVHRKREPEVPSAEELEPVTADETSATAEGAPAESDAMDAEPVAAKVAPGDEIELVEQVGYDPATTGEAFVWFDDPAEPDARADQEAAAAAVQRRIRDEKATQISFAPEPRRWWVAGVSVVLLLALAVQIFYFQLPSWSLDPGLRPLYERFCGITGCALPEMRDINAMRTRDLVVRSHPDVDNALVVDAVIVNQAPFPQPFPDLELKFTAVGGGLVAGRRFAPAEYLAGGELAATGLMPAKTPVQVSLEIEDPGPAAVNYTLSFRESS